MTVQITPLVDPRRHLSGHRLAWLASDSEGVPAGTVFLYLFTRAEQHHLALLELNVHPAERDSETGPRLLHAAIEAAREDGRRRVVAHVKAGSPGEGPLSAGEFRRVLTLTSARLPLAEVNLATLDAILRRPRPGYRSASWDGVVPDDLADGFVATRRAMNDTPTGGVDLAAVPWDLARVKSIATSVEQRGEVLHTVAAVSEADGAIAGFTELALPGDGTGDATHLGTAVLPEHRGHGLGLWMKAASIRTVHERHPALSALITDTAEQNSHMRQINDLLGYLPTHATHEYQLDLPLAPHAEPTFR